MEEGERCRWKEYGCPCRKEAVMSSAWVRNFRMSLQLALCVAHLSNSIVVPQRMCWLTFPCQRRAQQSRDTEGGRGLWVAGCLLWSS